MKKQFFYAALAIGMMSSCSSNDLPGNQQPENPNIAEDKVAIELGVDIPAVVKTRGTGSVGSTEGVDNKWNGQDLGIFMVERGTMQPAKDNGAYIFEGESFRAPFADVDPNNGKAIKFKTGNVKYYPMQGSYDFYGYHFDGSNVSLSSNPVSDAEQIMTLTGEINGTNDVMAAKTKLTSQDSVLLINKALNNEKYRAVTNQTIQTLSGELITDNDNSGDLEKLNAEIAKTYSSYSSRRDVKPTLNFKHLLARLKFNVRAGEDQAAIDNYSGSGTIEPHYFPALDNVDDGEYEASSNVVYGTESQMTDQAVYIRSLKVTGQKYDLTVTYKPNEAPSMTAADLSIGDSKGTFTLMQRKENEPTAPANDLETLIPVAPEKLPTVYTPTAVGESMMIVPGTDSFDIEIQVMQYVMTNDGSGVSPAGDPTYKWKLYTLKTKVKAPAESPATGYYEAGKSYNINITVYGFQKIEVLASLEGWMDGGTVESSPEDDVFNQGY